MRTTIQTCLKKLKNPFYLTTLYKLHRLQNTQIYTVVTVLENAA
jgi:hypothetical protein